MIPSWMQSQENYEPQKDHDRFLEKSLLVVFSVLGKFRENAGTNLSGKNAALKLVFTMAMILSVSLARTLWIPCIMLALLLIRIAVLPIKIMKQTLQVALTAAVIAGIFLIPAAIFGNPRTMGYVALKVFLSVGLLQLLAATTPWNALTASFKVFHVPDLFILIFDLALINIELLGRLSAELLTALKLRSVGKNPKKREAMAGILGTTFLHAERLSEETYQAMVCRGFTGEYKRPQRRKQ